MQEEVVAGQFSCERNKARFIGWNAVTVIEIELIKGQVGLFNDSQKVKEIFSEVSGKMNSDEVNGVDLCESLFKNIGISRITQVERICIGRELSSFVQKSGSYLAVVDRHKKYSVSCQMIFKKEKGKKKNIIEYYYRIPMIEMRKNQYGQYIFVLSDKNLVYGEARDSIMKSAIEAIESFETKVTAFIKKYC